MFSRNTVMKTQYKLFMISFALDFFFWIDRFQFSFTYGALLRALRGRGCSAKKKEIRQV